MSRDQGQITEVPRYSDALVCVLRWRYNFHMPRPDKETRKRIEANKKANALRRDDIAAQEKRTAERVQKILDEALSRPRSRETLPDLHNLIEKLESAYNLAMATCQPKAATDTVMAM